MKRSTYLALLTAAMCCLFFTQTTRAQDTLTYATVDYDGETNTIYGYAYTEPDYAASVYYGTTYVGAKLRDADDNQLAVGSQQTYGRAELFLQASGNGNGPYKIQSGHYTFMSYYVYSYWDSYAYQYRDGYLDYYYYTYFSEGPGGPVFDFPFFFIFNGRQPETITPSINRFLGTLLTSFLEPSAGTVRYKTVRVGSTSRDFDSNNSAEFPLNEASGGDAYCHGGATNAFTVNVTFDLPSDTTHVHQDARSYLAESDQNQYSHISRYLTFSNINLSTTPQTGQASFSIHRKGEDASYPDNKVKFTIAGRRSGGGGFSTGGRIRFTCP